MAKKKVTKRKKKVVRKKAGQKVSSEVATQEAAPSSGMEQARAMQEMIDAARGRNPRLRARKDMLYRKRMLRASGQ